MSQLYPISNSSKPLCEVCDRLDISTYFQSALNSHVDNSGFVGATSQASKLGFFKDIYQRAIRCAFCYIVIRAICTKTFHRTSTAEAIIQRDKTRNKSTECWIYSYCFASTSSPRNTQRAYRIGVASRVGKRGFTSPEDHLGDIQLLSGDSMRLFGSESFYGRFLRFKRVDPGLPRHWLSTCEREHGLCERRFGMSPEKPSGLLAVDVQRRCICRLPAGSRYVALSYCWQSADSFKLKKDNFDELLQPSSLERISAFLPGVIRDAIKFVPELGESYLWIDALCIIQDSDEHKQLQLSQMDRVYASAVLTIVAASATMDVEKLCGGLPRFNEEIECRPQISASVQNCRLLVPSESLISLLDFSKWNTRGWTYQELLLSRRLLFFTDTQVYFQCARRVFCEDGVGERITNSTYISPASNLWNPGSASSPGSHFGSLHLQPWPFANNQQAVQEYGTHVENYTRRSLSYSTDILNAFHGIQNILEQSLETKFWFGIPERLLDAGLLWQLSGVHKRRFMNRISRTPTDTMFPSWSWLGWESSVTIGSYFQGGVRRDVSWFLVNQKGEAVLMESEDIDGCTSFPQQGNRRMNTLELPGHSVFDVIRPKHLVDTTSEDWKSPKYLASWTMVASFRLNGDVASLSGHRVIWPEADNFAISDCNGRWVGSVMMDRKWAKNTLSRSLIFPFILMSRSEDISLISYPEVKFFDSEVFPLRPWCFMNVMLVEFSGKSARRLGVGVIHEDAWSKAVSTKRLILLE